MTIEFHCPTCSKLLRTADDKAGVRAKCPDCGTPVTVPAGDDSVKASGDETDIDPSGPPPIPGRSMKFCPMCGERIVASATQCSFCGEVLTKNLPRSGKVVPTRMSVSDVVDRSWEAFKIQWGISIAITFLLGIMIFACMLPIVIFNKGMEAAGQNPSMLSAFLPFGATLVMLYPFTGYWIALLKIARGEPASIADLFSGGRFYLRLLGAMVVVFLAVFVLAFAFSMLFGLVFALSVQFGGGAAIAGTLMVGSFAIATYGFMIYVELRLSPFILFVIDRDAGVFEAFAGTWRITANNVLRILLLLIVSFLLYVLGFLALLVGAFVAIPVIFLIQTTAYLAMTGQLEERRGL